MSNQQAVPIIKIHRRPIFLPCTSSYSLSCFARGRQQRSSPSAQVCSPGRFSGLAPEVSVLLWSRRQCSHHYQTLRVDTASRKLTIVVFVSPSIHSHISRTTSIWPHWQKYLIFRSGCIHSPSNLSEGMALSMEGGTEVCSFLNFSKAFLLISSFWTGSAWMRRGKWRYSHICPVNAHWLVAAVQTFGPADCTSW